MVARAKHKIKRDDFNEMCNTFISVMQSSITSINRKSLRIMMNVFNDYGRFNPDDSYEFKKYAIKRVYRYLKQGSRTRLPAPYVNCRGEGNRGEWGFCIPDDKDWKNYDLCLENIQNGIQGEREHADKRTKKSRIQAGEVIKAQKKLFVEEKEE